MDVYIFVSFLNEQFDLACWPSAFLPTVNVGKALMGGKTPNTGLKRMNSAEQGVICQWGKHYRKLFHIALSHLVLTQRKIYV